MDDYERRRRELDLIFQELEDREATARRTGLIATLEADGTSAGDDRARSRPPSRARLLQAAAALRHHNDEKKAKTSAAHSLGCSAAGKCPPRGSSEIFRTFVYPFLGFHSERGAELKGSFGTQRNHVGTVIGVVVRPAWVSS